MSKRLVLDLAELVKQKNKTRKPTEVPTPEMADGAVAFILNPVPDDRDLAELQWIAYRKSTGKTGTVGFRKFLVTWCLTDESNTRVFDSGKSEDRVTNDFVKNMEALAESFEMRAYMRLFDVAHKNMGLNTDDIEELVGNSPKTRRDGGSGSKPKRRAKPENNGSVSSTTSTS